MNEGGQTERPLRSDESERKNDSEKRLSALIRRVKSKVLLAS